MAADTLHRAVVLFPLRLTQAHAKHRRTPAEGVPERDKLPIDGVAVAGRQGLIRHRLRSPQVFRRSRHISDPQHGVKGAAPAHVAQLRHGSQIQRVSLATPDKDGVLAFLPARLRQAGGDFLHHRRLTGDQ
ncbi:hypothetical protein SRABI106_04891 [Rahnella aquatilis]|nr:hypothetical protein SRABI106_04891 [Rahnella aquatilis]